MVSEGLGIKQGMVNAQRSFGLYGLKDVKDGTLSSVDVKSGIAQVANLIAHPGEGAKGNENEESQNNVTWVSETQLNQVRPL